MPTARPLLLATSLLPAALGAVEPVMREIQAAAEQPLAAFAYRLDNGATQRTGSDRLQDPVGGRLGARWSWGAPGSGRAHTAGADLGAEQASYERSGDWKARHLDLTAGQAWQRHDRWSLAGEALLGGALMSLTTPPIGHPAQDFRGWAWRAGVRGSARWHPDRRWVLWAEAGWLHEVAELVDGDVALQMTRSGPVAALGLSWRWSYVPPGLE